MSYSAETSTQGTAGRSFALQYTSLILIVLTFVIGGLARQALPVQYAPASGERERIAEIAPEIGQLSYDDLFHTNGQRLNEDAVLALETLLQSHDVRAQVTLFADPQLGQGQEEAGFERALARSVELSRYLYDRGLPGESFEIVVRGELAAHQAVVRFYRD